MPAGTLATVAAVPGTLGTPAVLALEMVAGADAPAGAVCWAGLGKNVAFFPLCTCHWSQSMTMEKPKITHKMVRRISFMKVSFQREKRAAA